MAGSRPSDEVAIVAVTSVLRGYRDDAEKRLPGVLAGDVEDLHQFRVAMRRARTVVSAAHGVLPDEHRDRVGRTLRSMAALTSPVRDLDVFIADLPDLCEKVPEVAPGAADALVEIAVATRERPSVRLEWALRGPDGRHLFEDWELVSTPVPPGGSEPGALATAPAVDVVDLWIAKAFKRTRRKGRVALESDDLEHWHELRKALKKLRYLVAAFGEMHSGKRLKPVRKRLRTLQEHIGSLQDLRVQMELASELHERAVAADLHAAADLALGIRGQVSRRLALAHAECTDAWQEFDVPRTRQAFKALTVG